MGEAAAENTVDTLRNVIESQGLARVIFATGNSQLAFVRALHNHKEFPWNRVTVFHLDEYTGVTENHPASFRKWIREQIEEPLKPRVVHYIKGDAGDLAEETDRYTGLLREAPIDLVCMGIGENGHLAFNDPPVADFDDPVLVKLVELSEESRQQQVHEGHFRTLLDVPTQAISLTIPALLAASSLQIVVPEKRKAEAVRRLFTDPIETSLPATVLRTQSQAKLFLDSEAASSLSL